MQVFIYNLFLTVYHQMMRYVSVTLCCSCNLVVPNPFKKRLWILMTASYLTCDLERLDYKVRVEAMFNFKTRFTIWPIVQYLIFIFSDIWRHMLNMCEKCIKSPVHYGKLVSQLISFLRQVSLNLLGKSNARNFIFYICLFLSNLAQEVFFKRIEP